MELVGCYVFHENKEAFSDGAGLKANHKKGQGKGDKMDGMFWKGEDPGSGIYHFNH